ncbi:hypothetical protein [Kitasatospora sp. MBT63]|uniref:hypothetical protein n=1 Tax=Kitasatospora sp. MBT63 TaxID=1444768 RepID=UPI00053B7006|nr:hypothetical protein [Kitasatospora sp. MBT63]
MTHNDVARRTAHDLPARSLTPRLRSGGATTHDVYAPRALTRRLPARSLTRYSADVDRSGTEGGR